MVDGGYGYAASERTLRLSAPRPSGGKRSGAMVTVSVRRDVRLASGAFNGGGVPGLRIDAVGKAKVVVDYDERGEEARQEEKGDVQAAPMSNSGEKTRVQKSGRWRHGDQDCGCHRLRGHDAEARQHADEVAERPIGLGRASRCSGATATDRSKTAHFHPSTQKSSRTETSKPRESNPRGVVQACKETDKLTDPPKEQK